MEKLKVGAAYHGNRMLSHAITDMKDMAKCDMDVVVHMLSHNDWERHSKVMGDIFKASEDAGLEVWVDNWGLSGSPGDKSHFLAYHPEARVYMGNGTPHRFQACLNAPSYRQFCKDWLDVVREIGGKKIFWDEPVQPTTQIPDSPFFYASCTCPTCRKIFEERFNKPMPEKLDEDVKAFRDDTLVDFLTFVSDYAKSLGMENSTVIQPQQVSMGKYDNPMHYEWQLKELVPLDRICSIDSLNDIGTDPYWYWSDKIVGYDRIYDHVYNKTKDCLAVTEKHGKQSNIWLQSYGVPRGREDEIITAAEAIYDAGARTVLSWAYGGSEAVNYRAKNPEKSWAMTVEGFKRIKSMERDRILEENRKRFKK